jgi:hypothetical protein
MYCLEAIFFHYSKLHRIVSFKVVVGICTCIIDIVFEGISLVSLLKIILHIIIDPVTYINELVCDCL